MNKGDEPYDHPAKRRRFEYTETSVDTYVSNNTAATSIARLYHAPDEQQQARSSGSDALRALQSGLLLQQREAQSSSIGNRHGSNQSTAILNQLELESQLRQERARVAAQASLQRTHPLANTNLQHLIGTSNSRILDSMGLYGGSSSLQSGGNQSYTPLANLHRVPQDPLTAPSFEQSLLVEVERKLAAQRQPSRGSTLFPGTEASVMASPRRHLAAAATQSLGQNNPSSQVVQSQQRISLPAENRRSAAAARASAASFLPQSLLPTENSLLALHRPVASSNSQFHANNDRLRLLLSNNMNRSANPVPQQYGAGATTASSEAARAPSRIMPPVLVEGSLPHYSERTIQHLGTQENSTWCSDMNRCVRCELVEVFRASGQDVADRINNKRVVYKQIGLRCKYCAHQAKRTRRASAFPSSIHRIQASVSMMVREHFSGCKELPESVKASFLAKLEAEQHVAPGSTRSNHWVETASALGLVDTKDGIMHESDVSLQPQPSAFIAGFNQMASSSMSGQQELLVEDVDSTLADEYSYLLMTQARRISLTDADLQQRPKNRGTNDGFGCSFCHQDAAGGGRFFPSKRRLLNRDVALFYKHLQTCPLCPQEVKESLSTLKESADRQKTVSETEDEKTFFSTIWTRIRGHVPIGVPMDCSEDNTESLELGL